MQVHRIEESQSVALVFANRHAVDVVKGGRVEPIAGDQDPAAILPVDQVAAFVQRDVARQVRHAAREELVLPALDIVKKHEDAVADAA